LSELKANASAVLLHNLCQHCADPTQGAVRRELVQLGDASASLLRFDKALPSDRALLL